jgi:hypothetical protein
MRSERIAQLCIRKLLEEGDYVIPMYQRNYAWEEAEIAQLIQDVVDVACDAKKRERKYYLGTLVVDERLRDGRTVYETIDGQQRLTTLALLAAYLKREGEFGDIGWYEKQRIHFESRENSKRTLDAIFANRVEALGPSEVNSAILNGYRLIERLLPTKLMEQSMDKPALAAFLFERVQILRVPVPEKTDLNHYFEVMNNRGEQLEKHEVLKASLMEVLSGIPDETERKASLDCLDVVWEACANMEKYVQMGFRPEQRDAVFGQEDWGSFKIENFPALRDALKGCKADGDAGGAEQSLKDILATKGGAPPQGKDDNEEGQERFNTIINFPNFLLHILCITTQTLVPLDDKRLIETFDELLLEGDARSKVEQFIFDLLRGKFLYDQYVIKREFVRDRDGWSLKRLNKNASGGAYYVHTFGEADEAEGIQRRILMLLAAFHVSSPTLVYKHWLHAALRWLFQNRPITAQAYLQGLESLAKAFVFDRFLAPQPGADYQTMVMTNGGKCQASKESDCDWNRLSFGNTENLIFNYLDYLLWQKEGSNVSNFEFTFRSSVEHFYPQHPKEGHAVLPPEVLNCFGNLCLISHSKNSTLSNYMPTAKKDHYKAGGIDSVKQHLMMRMMETREWNAECIRDHEQEMKEVFVKDLEGH